VVWRLGGSRDGAYQSETFSAGTDAVNLERARGFKSMVDAAGQRWPEGWVRGEGFVRPSGADPMRPPPRFNEIGEEYVRQIVDLSPGQRRRYLGQLRVLASTQVKGELVFARPVSEISEADLREWLLTWDRSVKTKSNYHGLIHGVFAHAVSQGWLAVSPTVRTGLKSSRVRQARPELRFLTEHECEAAVRLTGKYGDLLTVAVGTGLRFGELSALWVPDIDLERRTIRVNKAWKLQGEHGATDVPPWLARLLKPKHTMREHYLGNPKTAKSRRTVSISAAVAAALAGRIEGRAPDDFVFTTRGRRPLHNGDFHTSVWSKLMTDLEPEGIGRFRFHDLRHTHVAWLVAGGAPLPHIQARLGHESITTTIDTYGHLLPAGDELISAIIDTVLGGRMITPALP
jgi:integrase